MKREADHEPARREVERGDMRTLSPGGICQRSGCLGERDAVADRVRVDVHSRAVHPLGGRRNALVVESGPMGDVVWRDA